MSLNAIETQRIVAILYESLKKLDLLDYISTEHSTRKEELSDMVNDEISRIIEEQRRLQIKYEELIMQRSMLKNVSNKTKYKEIQTEIEETATALRYATKVLCRNLKENPDVAENISKLQKERTQLRSLFSSLVDELKESGSYKKLLEALERDRKRAEEVKSGTQKVKTTQTEIKQLQDEIAEQLEERRRDENNGNEAIQRIHEELQDLRANTILESKYQKKEAKARLDAARRVFSQQEKQNEQDINFLVKRIEIETKVSEEAETFLERKYEELQHQTETWDTKWEQDIEEKEREVQELKSKKAATLMKLMDLKQKYKEIDELLKKEKRLAEAKAFAKEMQNKRNQAATSIQNAWRKYKKLKQAKEKFKKLKKAAKQAKKKEKGKKQPQAKPNGSRPSSSQSKNNE